MAERIYTEPEGYTVQVCTCPGGPHIGTRKAGTPDCCQRCGYVTPEQMTAIREALRKEYAGG